MGEGWPDEREYPLCLVMDRGGNGYGRGNGERLFDWRMRVDATNSFVMLWPNWNKKSYVVGGGSRFFFENSGSFRKLARLPPPLFGLCSRGLVREGGSLSLLFDPPATAKEKRTSVLFPGTTGHAFLI